MTWRDGVRNVLMGSSYEEYSVVAATEVSSPLVSVPIHVPEPAMAMEEAIISALRRAEFLSDAAVMSPHDPSVRAARFRKAWPHHRKPASPGLGSGWKQTLRSNRDRLRF